MRPLSESYSEMESSCNAGSDVMKNESCEGSSEGNAKDSLCRIAAVQCRPTGSYLGGNDILESLNKNSNISISCLDAQFPVTKHLNSAPSSPRSAEFQRQ